jgi:hypothetical protein
MNGEEHHTFTVNARTGTDRPRRSSEGEYMAVPLPDEIEDIGFSVGDRPYVKLDSHEFQGKTIEYMRVSKQRLQTRHKYTIRRREDLHPELFLRIPVEYTDASADTSFAGLKKDDDLAVELNKPEKEIRVYTPSHSQKRRTELTYEGKTPKITTPTIAAFITRDVGGYADIARQTEFPGQKFQIVFWDPYDEIFEKTVRKLQEKEIGMKFDETYEDYQYGDSIHNKLYMKVMSTADDYDLYRRVYSVKIEWGPNPGRRQPIKEEKLQTVYSEYFTRKCKVILPEKGVFVIKIGTEKSISRARLGYRHPEGPEKEPPLNMGDGKRWFSGGILDFTNDEYLTLSISTPLIVK